MSGQNDGAHVRLTLYAGALSSAWAWTGSISWGQMAGLLMSQHEAAGPVPPPRADGKPQVPQDLRKRIRYHFGAGNASADGSTLRKSLGVLLGDQLGFALRRIGSGKRQTFAGGEAVLTRWMAENVSVSWVLHPEPWYLEAKLLTALDLPLNIQDNEHNTFAPQLKKLRRDAAVKAGKMRVLAEWS